FSSRRRHTSFSRDWSSDVCSSDLEKHISTTALARLLAKESKELFILLTGGGWIIKVDNHWQLTEKGKFEGGVYVNHPKYGEYIRSEERRVGKECRDGWPR